MFATVLLAQDGGTPGPKATIETTLETAVNDAIAWAEGQAGHPWDVILVTVYNDDDQAQRNPLETHQIEYRDDSWEVV